MRIATTTLGAVAVLFFAVAQGGFAGDRADLETVDADAVPAVRSGPPEIPESEVEEPAEAPPLASIDWVVDSEYIEREPRDD
jgi:hypothetical protein